MTKLQYHAPRLVLLSAGATKSGSGPYPEGGGIFSTAAAS